MRTPKDRILENMDATEYWFEQFPEWDGRSNVQCPRTELHENEDSNSSLSLHPEGKFHCFGCSWKGTNVIGYHADVHHAGNFSAALAELFHIHVQELVKDEDWRTPHALLLGKKKRIRQRILAARGWNEETLTRFSLGWDSEMHRVTIPVFNPERLPVDLRKYDALGINRKEDKKSPKMLQWDQASEGSLYPLWPGENPFEHDEVFILEGEPDVILARQEGLNALTLTGGCDVLKSASYDTLSIFEGKHVVLCLDNDKAGKEAALKLAKRLASVELASLKVVRVPHGNDLTEFLMDKGGSIQQLLQHIRAHKFAIRPATRRLAEVSLADSSRAEHVGRMITTKVLASGKGRAPLIIPKRLEFRCHTGDAGYCATCPCRDTGKSDHFVLTDDPLFLKWMTTPAEKYDKLIKESIGATCRCAMTVTPTELQNVEQVTLIPALQNKSLTDETVNKYVSRKAYYVGHGIDTNKHYEIRALPQAHPKTKESVLVVRDAAGSSDSFESFTITEEEVNELRGIFRRDAWSSLKRVARVLATNHTRICGRDDLHIAVDLCFHSPLAFTFDSFALPKGSLEILLLGDTRTGKGTVAEGLVRLYDLGAVISGENASFMGLVGGLSKLDDQFTLQWGAIPLNNGRLVVIDEVSGLGDVLGNLSRIRSEGVAEINKGGIHSSTDANTRIIWIANPRKGKELAEFGTGVEAVMDLARTQEDVARFDLVVLVGKNEVRAEDINRAAADEVKTKFTPDVLRKVLLWVWSRKPSQIEFTGDAVKIILKNSIALAKKYAPTIPLVQGENVRFKLAKLAAAIAGRVFSTPDGTRLVVKKEHAVLAIRLLQWFYDKPVCAYDEFSGARSSKEKLVKLQDLDAIFDNFTASKDDIIDGLLESHQISIRDLQDWLDVDRMVAENYMGIFVRCHALKKVKGGMYEKRQQFIKYLKDSR